MPTFTNLKNTYREFRAVCVLGLLGAFALGSFTLGACDDGHNHDDHEHDHAGTPTEAVCPETQTLTYDNFGRAFMQSYCVRCHSSTLVGDEARMDAPAGHDFDTLAGIQEMTDHIDEQAGSGPAATNTVMPYSDPSPTLEERKKLSEWLACGAP